MMNQFEVLVYMGNRYLTIIDLSRYDYMIGFRRILTKLEN